MQGDAPTTLCARDNPLVTPATEELVRERCVDALTDCYQQVDGVAATLQERDFLRPTRCLGWTVGDLLFHMLLDADRALRAFASPAEGPPDVDFVTYWEPWSNEDPGSVAHARFVRLSASAHQQSSTIARRWQESSAAALRAAKAADTKGFVSTQGHVLAVPDFVATLVVEAAVHHLDLVVDLPGAPEPETLPLALVRATAEGLLGSPAPARWDDRTLALKATGRAPVTAEEQAALGELAARLPVFS